MLNPAEAETRKLSLLAAKQSYDKDFGDLDLTDEVIYKSLIELYWYSKLPCLDLQRLTSQERGESSLLKRCYWKGELMSCAAIFTTRPTDRGMCCSFNAKAADEMYQASRYTSALQELQNQDKNLSFPALDNEKTVVKDFIPQGGLEKGLALVLDSHADKVAIGSVSDNFQGFVATISSRNDFPITSRKPLMIKPGHLNIVGISAINIQADDNIRKYRAEQRKCYFEDEHPLKIFKKYSQRNCQLERSLEYASKLVQEENANFNQCVPWFYPVNDDVKNTSMCDPWEQKVFQEKMGMVPRDEYAECLPDCKGNIYDTKVDRAVFKKCDHTNLGASTFCDLESGDINPSIWSQEAREEFQLITGNIPYYLFQNPENQTLYSSKRSYQPHSDIPFQNNMTYNAFENDIAMVHFYFEREDILQLKRSEKVSIADLLSSFGGNLGLGLGFSCISLAEIIYWLTIRLWQNMIVDRKH